MENNKWDKEIEEYRDHVNELRQDTHWGRKTDGPTRFFGYKSQHELDGIINLFTHPDWGNIEKFMVTKLDQAYKRGVEDTIRKMICKCKKLGCDDGDYIECITKDDLLKEI